MKNDEDDEEEEDEEEDDDDDGQSTKTELEEMEVDNLDSEMTPVTPPGATASYHTSSYMVSECLICTFKYLCSFLKPSFPFPLLTNIFSLHPIHVLSV